MAAKKKNDSLVDRRRRNGSDDDDALSAVADTASETSSVNADRDDVRSTASEQYQMDTQGEAGQRHGDTETKADNDSTDARSLAPGSTVPASDSTFTPTADTQVMTNGLGDLKQADGEQKLDYETLQEDRTVEPQSDTPADRRKAEQDQYRQKRDTDPTMIPSRGSFFMHDARAVDQRGFNLGGRGRGGGRGRPFIGGPFSPASNAHGQRAAEAPWAHDLHETINEPMTRGPIPNRIPDRTTAGKPQSTTDRSATAAAEYRPYSFSTSKIIGKVQVRIAIPGMPEAIPVAGVIIEQHTRLPDHRPPLRRDKPVRVSLPDRPPRYLFPSQERSFIFIPRAMRPNQANIGRSRAGISSRRTSVYGGSSYTPSISMSRRSSIARDIPRDHMFSPGGSAAGRHFSTARPVVKLPQGLFNPAGVTSPVGPVVGYGVHAFPLPQTPAVEHYRETTMMHPKPQKAISVSGIDSPAALSLHAPQQQPQQPFENQLPHHAADGSFGSSYHPEAAPPQYYAYQGQAGTPLSNIPERAIHARPFQPPGQPHGHSFYGQYAQAGYYYPTMPVFAPSQATAPQQAAPADQTLGQGQSQASMMAHETNGMVYYLDAQQVSGYPQQPAFPGQDGYLSASSYAVPGAGGMMTPSPEAAWYYGNGAVYYPQQGQ